MAPLLPETITRGSWECSTCTEEYDALRDPPWVTTKEADLVCASCIRSRFEKSLENDYSWPARFGADELHASDYMSILSVDLVSRLTARTAEYAASNDTPAMEAVDGQIRGRDYQTCPSCSKIVSLHEGCNHMTCVCLAHFCYICGEELERADVNAHWALGACPHYGHVGSGRAIFGVGGNDADAQAEMDLILMEEWWEEQQLMNEALDFDHFVNFHVETWAWNVAMQSLAGDPARQGLLLQVFEPTPLGTAPGGEEENAVIEILAEHNPMHVVPPAEWQALVTAAAAPIANLVHDGPHPLHAGVRENDSLYRGLLMEPVFGVYNMSSPDKRAEALMWMHDAIRDWDTENDEDRPHSSAVFTMGPGANEERLNIATIMRFLFTLQEIDRFTFTPMQHGGLLVTLRRPPLTRMGDREFAMPDGYWRKRLIEDFWGPIIHLDTTMEFDQHDHEWGHLWRSAARESVRQARDMGIEPWWNL